MVFVSFVVCFDFFGGYFEDEDVVGVDVFVDFNVCFVEGVNGEGIV